MPASLRKSRAILGKSSRFVYFLAKLAKNGGCRYNVTGATTFADCQNDSEFRLEVQGWISAGSMWVEGTNVNPIAASQRLFDGMGRDNSCLER